MQQKLFALVIIAILAVSAGYIAAADNASLPEEVEPSESLVDDIDDVERDVIDPDDQLTDEDVEHVIDLTWNENAVRDTFEESEPRAITVQATGDLDEVEIAFVGENKESVAAVVDLKTETVVRVVPTEFIVPGEGVKVFDLPDDEKDSAEGITDLIESELLLPAAEVTIVDDDGLLSDDEATLVETLLMESQEVDSHLKMIDQDGPDSGEWLFKTAEFNGSVIESDDRSVRVTITYDGIEPGVQVLVNLDEQAVESVVSVYPGDDLDSDTSIKELDGIQNYEEQQDEEQETD